MSAARLIALALAGALAAPLPGSAAQAAQGAPAQGAAPTGAPAADGDAPIIDEVVLETPPGEDVAALTALLPLRRGEPVSRRELRRTVQLLHQLGRFSNVVVRSEPRGEGRVLLRITCTPRRVIREVRVENPSGRSPLTAAQVLALARLVAGDEIHAARADAAAERVRAELQRRGWRSARVTARVEGEQDARVALVVEEGPPTPVLAVELEGDAGPKAERLLAALRTQAGGVHDVTALDADLGRLRRLLREDGHLRARVGTPRVREEAGGVRIAIPVEAGPRVSFRFPGATIAGPEELRAALGLEPDAPLDAPALEAATARLTTWYQQRGHAAVRVSMREVTADGASTLVFDVAEGPRYRVAAVRFPGAAHFSEEALRERLAAALAAGAPAAPAEVDVARAARAVGSRRPERAAALPPAEETWEPVAWAAAAGRLVEAYRDAGFLDAAHRTTQATLDARSRTVTVELGLEEGPRTRVASVTFEGASAIPVEELAPLSRVRQGDALSLAALEQSRALLLERYAARGHLYARVDAVETLSDDRTSADVRFRIEEGPRVHVGHVVLSGNRRTRDDVVREALALRPGDVWDSDAVARSQAQLLGLGVFRSVGLRLSDPEIAEGEKDLTVELSERPWRTLAPGVGFSIANGPRAFVELVQPNLFGRAIEGTARAKVNYPLATFRADVADRDPLDRVEGRVDLGLHDPRFRSLPVPAGARLDLIGERLHRRAYDLARGSLVAGLDLAATRRVSLSLQYEFEVDQVLKSASVERLLLTRADVERLRFPEGYTTLHAFRPVLALDFRDNSIQPRRGWYASATTEWAHSLGGRGGGSLFGIFPGSDVYTNMLKLSGTASAYVPLGGRSVFALSLRAGRVVPLDGDSQTIGPKRFYLGGAATMRGWAEDEVLPEDVRDLLLDQVRACAGSPSGAACSEVARQIASGTLASEGGESFYLAKAELRIPLSPRLEAGLFADAGNLWLDPAEASLRRLRFDAGIGLRIVTPIGPAVIDLGFNLDPDERLGEDLVAPHFSIGLF